MPNDLGVRRTVLLEAAFAMCPHCRGSRGHNPVPVRVGGDWWHHLTHGNGWNKCDAGPIRSLLTESAEQGGLS